MACRRLGVKPDVSSRALASFKGIQRRLELVGAAGGIAVIDDYAHNPAKIAAAFQAVKPFHKRVIAVWRPHGFGPLAMLADDLAAAFAGLVHPPDILYLLPVYYAGGTAKRTMTAESFVERLREGGIPAEFAPGYEELLAGLLGRARPGDVVLFMGARDPGLPVFARRFLAELGHLVAQRAPCACGV